MTALHVIIRHHDGVEEARDLIEGELAIGRAEGNWLCPLDEALSRCHAVLHVAGDQASVESLPTRNGTFVNGDRLPAGKHRLRPGDEIVLGRTRLSLCAGPANADARRQQPTAELGRARAGSDEEMVVASPQMVALLEHSRRLARSTMPVLITGESGTGKELLARSIHRWSGRPGPFVVLNCPALTATLVESELFGVEAGVATGVSRRSGRLEQADRGTLFLDEVADLSPEAQAKLLRFLQDGTLERVGGRKTIAVDVRVVAATNRELDPEDPDCSLRSDLFFRISGLSVEIPPLRRRPADLEPLVDLFLLRGGHGHLELSSAAREALTDYHFPGNVRELAAVIERAALLADGSSIGVDQLGLAKRAGARAEAGVADRGHTLLERLASGEGDFWQMVHRPFIERELERVVVQALVAEGLERTGGSVRGLAELLHTPQRYRKLLDFLRNNRLMPG